ncbi:hypothetical protein [Nocardia tengchongensis]|uniref:hypothetical protein n=1 Tax=Nocardia tengchongensis TaxID=2055889 RepID=UPI0036A84952
MDGTDNASDDGTGDTSAESTYTADSVSEKGGATTGHTYGHTRDIPALHRPPGASAALKSFLGMCDTAIQTAVDLLGRELTEPPPTMDDLLTKVVYTTLGTGTSATGYEQTLTAVETRRSALLTLDGKVLEVASTLTDDKDQNLAYIKTVVEQLDTGLRSLGSAKLTSQTEYSVMNGIGDAVHAIYQRVSQAAAKNAEMAGAGQSDGDTGAQSGATGTPTTAGSGAGSDGGLGSSLGSMLTNVPMLVAALLPTVITFLEGEKNKAAKEEEKKKKEEEKAKKDDATKNAPGAPSPADPAATPTPADTQQPQPTPAGSPGQPTPASPAPKAVEPPSNAATGTPPGQIPAHPGTPATPVPAR